MLKNNYFIILVFLILILVIGYNIRFFYSKKKRSRHKAVDASVAAEPKSPARRGIDNQEDKGKICDSFQIDALLTRGKWGKEEIDLQKIRWGSDPFLSLKNHVKKNTAYIKGNTNKKAIRKENKKSKKKVNNFTIKAILISEWRKVAIINDAILHEGDKIDDKIVKSITPDQVILIDRQRRPITVSLEKRR